MSAAEVTEWQAYEQVAGPLGGERLDLLMAVLAATVANSAGSKRKMKPADFIPKWDRSRGQTWQEQLAMVKTMNKRFGGTVKGGMA
ncbi:MAG: phage tail assembly protein T [Pseudonocardiaceae bacterium]